MLMKYLIFLAVLLLLASNAYAIAVSSPYLENNVLRLQEETSTTFTLVLQNIEERDEEIQITVTSEAASLENPKEFYVIPAGNTNFPVNLKIVPPKNAKLGDTYRVEYSVHSRTVGSGFPIAVGINKRFTVEITKNSEKFYFGSYLRENGLLWITIFAILIGYVWYKRNEKKKRK